MEALNIITARWAKPYDAFLPPAAPGGILRKTGEMQERFSAKAKA